MITKQEITSVELSPTKKDFYQIWNELIDTATKLSTTWSPAATNEGDPGIVLLKVLTAIADKLEYNIDANTKEVYMPSAAQRESMRKLCSMMGYTLHHYQAASGNVTISFKKSSTKSIEDFQYGIYFPKFVNIKDADDSVNYVTVEPFTLSATLPSRNIAVLEGELVECETNNDNIITLLQLDDNHRYIFNDTHVAENGIFVSNISNAQELEDWIKVDNLNTRPLGKKYFKFDFDSQLNAPYIQFPDDIAHLIEDGLRIKYIRTSGSQGNVNIKTLTTLEVPELWKTATENADENATAISQLTNDDFKVINNSPILNGADPESLEDAYNNYKKTVGTFDTLVSCRDYMNKIYELTKSTYNTTPLVSNVVVSDIRDDINRSYILCSFNEYGIRYTHKTFLDTSGKPEISNFDIVLYPFTTVTGANTKNEYDNSFKYSAENSALIEQKIKNYKTLAHNITYPRDNDIVSIINYLRLKAKITTTRRVSIIEENQILTKVYSNIYANFNARKLDFGEEIPMETIEKVIVSSDDRIKDVNLDEPIIYTRINTKTGELAIASTDPDKTLNTEGAIRMNKLTLRNVLSGRISAFKYNTDFVNSFTEKQITITNGTSTPTTLPTNLPTVDEHGNPEGVVSTIKTKLYIDTTKISELGSKGLVLDHNEVIQFKAPNFRTTMTYPAYVNYYFIQGDASKSDESKKATPATFRTLYQYLNDAPDMQQEFLDYVGSAVIESIGKPYTMPTDIEQFFATVDEVSQTTGFLYYKCVEPEDPEDPESPMKDPEYIALWKIGSAAQYKTDWDKFLAYYADHQDCVKQVILAATDTASATAFTRFKNFLANSKDFGKGLYRNLGTATLNVPNKIGKLVDEGLFKYAECISPKTTVGAYYVPIHHDDEIIGTHTKDGLGADAVFVGIGANTEYELKPGDVLYINYTNSETINGEDVKNVINTVIEYNAENPKIIRANFDLIDSRDYHSSHSYSKKDGYKFPIDLEGMFTLGTDEQIELRERVTVTLDENDTSIYWFFNDGTLKLNDKLDENYTYTLQDGEYIFYTNSTQTDYNYYGSGTTIQGTSNTPELIKASGATITVEEILTYGLEADIPWVHVNLENSRAIVLSENTFINLTEDDALIEIDLADNATEIDNGWKTVNSASYKLSGSSTSVPLPTLNITNLHWEVRSRLDICSGPNTPQALNTVYTLDGSSNKQIVKQGSIEVTTRNDQTLTTYTYKAENSNITPTSYENKEDVSQQTITFKTNYTIQQANEKINIENFMQNYQEFITKYNLESLSDITNFKVRLTGEDAPVYIADSAATQGIVVPINNYNNDYTKVTFNEHSGLILNANLSSDARYGLMSLYYNNGDAYTPTTTGTSSTEPVLKHAQVRIYATDASQTQLKSCIKIFNDGTATYLDEVLLPETGIYNVEFKANANISKLVIQQVDEDYDPSDPASVPTPITCDNFIIFTSLYSVCGINPKLCYYDPADVTRTDTLNILLTDIRNIDKNKEFLYTVTPTSDTAIDLNSNISDETILSSTAWYDYNNLNNKFVISKIDSNYLSTGITLTKASKL